MKNLNILFFKTKLKVLGNFILLDYIQKFEEIINQIFILHGLRVTHTQIYVVNIAKLLIIYKTKYKINLRFEKCIAC